MSEGKFFAITFPQTSGGAGKCEIIITASMGAMISVDAPLAKVDDRNVYVAGGTSKKYSLGWNMRAPQGVRTNYPVYITSDKPIKVECKLTNVIIHRLLTTIGGLFVEVIINK